MPIEPIYATAGLELDHVPPPVLLLNEAVPLTHIEEGPVMGPGEALTVIILFVKQPVPSV